MRIHSTLISLLFILISKFSLADCNSVGLTVWPWNPTLKQEALIILEGMGGSQETVQNLDKDGGAWLISGNHKVKLNVTEICEGEFALTQALLKPSEKLREGKTYTLFLPDGKPNIWDPVKQEKRTAEWTVEGNTDDQLPVWKKKPVYKSKKMEFFGCGDAMSVEFDYEIEDGSPVAILAVVREVKTGKETMYYLTPHSTTISLGHGMCSGEFVFIPNEKYEATFIAVDNCGNRQSATQKYRFNAPSFKDQKGLK